MDDKNSGGSWDSGVGPLHDAPMEGKLERLYVNALIIQEMHNCQHTKKPAIKRPVGIIKQW